MSILDLETLYCSVDTFWQHFEPLWERKQVAAGRWRRRMTRLSPSKIMTILILFAAVGLPHLQGLLHPVRPTPVARRDPAPRQRYTRFVALSPRVLLPLAIYVQTQLGTCTGISFVDSTSLVVCHTARIAQHRVFRVDARRGTTWQDLGRLVLRVQTPSGRQRSWGVARLLSDTRQRR